MAKLIYHTLPGTSEHREHVPMHVQPEESLHSSLARAGVPITAVALYVKVDGVAVPTEQWFDFELPVESEVVVRPLLQGGGGEGDSDPLRVVLTISVLAAAPWAAGVIGGAIGGWAAGAAGTALIQAGVVGLGMAAINAVVPPQMPEISNAAIPSGAASPSYAARSLGNQARPGQPINLMAGRHRVVPDLLSQPRQSYTRAGESAVYSVFSVAQNAVNLTDWQLGEYAMQNYNVGTLTHTQLRPFAGSYVQISDPWGHLPDFADAVSTLDIGEEISGRSEDGQSGEAQEFIRAVPLGTARVDLDFAVQLYSLGEDGGAVRAEMAVQIHYRKKGNATWLSGVEQYDNSIATVPFGVWSQGKYDEQWPPQWQSVAIGSLDRNDNAYRTQPVAADGTHWRWLPWHMLHNSSVGPVHPGADARLSTWELVSYSSVVKRHTLFLHFNPDSEYEIRVSIPAQEETPRGAARVLWERMHNVQAEDGHARLQKRVGMVLVGSAETSQVQGQLSVVAEGELTSLLSSNPSTSNNPAHVLAALASGARQSGRRLFGGKLDPAELDLSALANWQSYCANMGHTSHRVWSNRESLEVVLAQVAADGGAVLAWHGGQLSVIFPQADDPVQDHISMADMVSGGFNLDYIRQPLPALAVLSFYNEQDQYKLDTRTITVPGGDDTLDPMTLEILGATNPARVVERGRLAIARQFYDRRRTKITLDLAGFIFDRGDVISLSHALSGWGYSGRLGKQSNTEFVRFGRDINLRGDGWVLYLKAADGTHTQHPINGSGESALWSVGINLPVGVLQTPEDYTWILDRSGTPGRVARIVDIVPKGQQVQLTLADEVAEFYQQRTALTLPEPPLAITAEAVTEQGVTPLYRIDLAELGWPGTLSNCAVVDGVLRVDDGEDEGSFLSNVLPTNTTAHHVPTVAEFSYSHSATLTARSGSTEAEIGTADFEELNGNAVAADYIQIKIDMRRSKQRG